MGWLLNLIPFVGSALGTIDNLTNKISSLKLAEIAADSEEDKAKIAQEIRVLEMQRDVLLAQKGREAHITNLVRTGLMLPVAVVLWKFLIWDKVIGSFVGCSGDTRGKPECGMFTTDDLQQNLWWFVFVVVGFYFVQSLSTIWKK